MGFGKAGPNAAQNTLPAVPQLQLINPPSLHPQETPAGERSRKPGLQIF